MKSADVNQKVAMVFADSNEAFTIYLRHGVAEIRQRPMGTIDAEDVDLHVVAEAGAWKEMLAKLRSPITTLAGFQYPKGNVLAFTRFMALFKPPKPKMPFESLD